MGLLHQGSKLIVGGSSKSYKTWTLTDLAVSVASGTPWLGFNTVPGKVLYVNLEIQPAFFRHRIANVVEAKHVDLHRRLDIWNLRGCIADYRSLIPKIRTRIRDQGHALVIIDPTYKLLGTTDENSATDITALLNIVESLATPAAGEITPTATPKDPPVKLDGVLGRVDGLSEAQQMEFYACEAVIETGWSTFVQVGLAFARIRDADLYTMEFDTFEAYCREKWQYGRHYVNRLILAAQVFAPLVTISHQRRPEHETQVRPLIGLTPPQAQLAWEHAVEKAAGKKITQRLVKAAVQELQLGGSPAPVTQQPRRNKAEQRRLVDDAIGQLLMLLSQKASHQVMTEKVEILHGHIQALFGSSH